MFHDEGGVLRTATNANARADNFSVHPTFRFVGRRRSEWSSRTIVADGALFLEARFRHPCARVSFLVPSSRSFRRLSGWPVGQRDHTNERIWPQRRCSISTEAVCRWPVIGSRFPLSVLPPPPPFSPVVLASHRGGRKAGQNPDTATGDMAAAGEVACHGGEVAFVTDIIRDSLRLRERVSSGNSEKAVQIAPALK